MGKFFLQIFALTVVALSCHKNQASFLPNGHYQGTFQRIVNDTGTVSQVAINFTNSNYSGESEYAKYPAICNGSFSGLGSDSINFSNACAWTAEFDWSFILNGHYKIVASGKNLQISRSFATYSDIYSLTKQ